MKCHAVIFDLDGTIVDTDGIWRKVIENLFAKHNVNFSKDQMLALENKIRYVGLDVACTIVKQEANIADSPQNLMQEIRSQACELYKSDIDFVCGFEDFHKKICDHGLKSGVATNADDKTLGHVKRQLRLESFFGEHIYGAERVQNRFKPDPAIYLYAAQKLGVEPQDCIAIEDSPLGIKAAQHAGIYCIGINTSGVRETLEKADMIVESYDQIAVAKISETN